ncbi:MAG: FAD-binding oxidoreductase [Patescibacteria group bacterium]
MSLAIEDLKKAVRGDVVNDQKTRAIYSEDASIFHLQPACVVSPKDTADLQSLVRYAHEHRADMSLTARAAGTDMSGGPLTTSVVVDFLKYFNKTLEVNDAGWARAQPGAYYRDFEKATLAKGWLLPCYTASRELNTVGGMVANNSGGEQSLTYGKTNRYAREIEMVLDDGSLFRFKKLTRAELEQVKSEHTRAGDIHRHIEQLIAQHQEKIAKAKPAVSKDSTGYALWDVWDRKADTFDLTQIIVGSQGTLGLISEIDFSLVRPKKNSQMLVIFLHRRDMQKLGHLVNAILAHKPESFESYDDHTFLILLKVLPSMLKRLGATIFSLGWKFLPEMRSVLTGGIPKLVLLAQFTSDDAHEARVQAEKARDDLASFHVQTHLTKDASESEKYWVIRRESFNLLRSHVHGKLTAPFIDDLSVLPEKLPEFLPKLYAILDEYDITYTIAGHVGDGNFHIIPLVDFSRPDLAQIFHDLSEKVYDLTFSFGGSMSGEHNDGLIRTPFLEKMYGRDIVALFEETKNIFDPLTIFNPHKKVNFKPELAILKSGKSA